MTLPRSLLALALFAPLAAVDADERIECPATADAWIAMPQWGETRTRSAEALQNHGRETELVVRGRESFAVLLFDVSGARGITVRRATLRIHREADPVPVHTVGLSTVSGSGSWSEGSVTFFQPKDGAAWSYPGSELVDVTFAQGGSLYSYERARDAGGGWWEVNVPPAIVQALVISDQYGLMFTDEKGQTQSRHRFSSRESAYPPVLILEGTRGRQPGPGPVHSMRQCGAGPGTGKSVLDSTPAGARRLGRTTLRPGSVILRFGGAGRAMGRGVASHYEVRYSARPIDAANYGAATPAPRWSLNPLAPKSGPLATSNSLRDEVTAVVEDLTPGAVYYFASRAMDEAGNYGPVSALGAYRAYARTWPVLPQPAIHNPAAGARPLQPSSLSVWAVPELLKIDPRIGALLEQKDFPEHRARNSVWDAALGSVRLTGARNEFVAFQLAVESARPLADVQVSVSRPLFPANRLPAVFRSTGAVQLYREWFVPDDKDTSASRPWYPDALVPLSAPFDLPAKDNPVPGLTVQPVFVDVYVPHDAAPGRHTGELLVRAAGEERRIRLEVEVLPLTLPDTLNFIVDLNSYSGVNSGWNMQRGTPEYRKLEQAYHRVAHINRANLEVLGYSHTGGTVVDHAPPIEGEGAAARVGSWRDWDAHFGPLVDGSAFADLPRASVPLYAMYLPFFENWPGEMETGYSYNQAPIAKTEEEYRAILTRHALESGPVEESFTQEYKDRYSAVIAQFAAHFQSRGWLRTKYLVYFNNKYYYRRPTQGGRGVSWWLLDEPNHRDDVRAISFLATLTRRGLEKYPGVPIRLRADISRVDWMRDLLAGQVDLNCVSRRFYEKNRYLMDDRYRFGGEFWNYASSNHPRDTNVTMRAWCWKSWFHGGGGVLPWNTVHGAEAWLRAEPLTLFYPAPQFGSAEPFASVRLKAFRRGQQDIEYLVLLASKRGWDRDAVTHAVAEALDLSGEAITEWEEDAGVITFRNVKDADLDAVRLRVAKAILAR